MPEKPIVLTQRTAEQVINLIRKDDDPTPPARPLPSVRHHGWVEVISILGPGLYACRPITWDHDAKAWTPHDITNCRDPDASRHLVVGGRYLGERVSYDLWMVAGCCGELPDWGSSSSSASRTSSAYSPASSAYSSWPSAYSSAYSSAQSGVSSAPSSAKPSSASAPSSSAYSSAASAVSSAVSGVSSSMSSSSSSGASSGSSGQAFVEVVTNVTVTCEDGVITVVQTKKKLWGNFQVTD